MQEMWHESIDSVSLRRAAPPGYATSKRVWSTGQQQHYGGVAIIHRSEYKQAKMTSLPKVNSFEYVCTRLHTVQVGVLVIASIYRPGSVAVTSDFFKELTTFLESLASYRCPIVLLGDFNIHTKRQDDVHSKKLAELLASFDLKQHLDEATHNLSGCLDFVVIRSDFFVNDLQVVEVGFSDHYLVTCRLPTSPPVAGTVPVEGRK